MNINIVQKLVAVVFLSTLLIIKVNAQHAYYSQYHLTPMLNNPALIATSDYLRVDIGYRNQFGGAASNMGTPLAAVTLPFFRDITPEEKRRTGVGGLQILNDRIGEGGLVSTSGASVSWAQNIAIASGEYIALGVQPGVYNRRISDNFTTGSQWNGYAGRYESSLPARENITGLERRTFLTINAGLIYYKEDNQGQQKYHISFGSNNISRPNISLNSSNFQNPVNWVATGAINAYENNEWIIQPTFRVIQQRNLNQTNIGSFAYYKLHSSNPDAAIKSGKLGFGAWYSHNNALITAIEFNQPDYSIGISYDFIISKLSQAPGRNGAPEIVVGFRKFLGKRKQNTGASGAPATTPKVEEQKPMMEEKREQPKTQQQEIKPPTNSSLEEKPRPTPQQEEIKSAPRMDEKPVEGKSKVGPPKQNGKTIAPKKAPGGMNAKSTTKAPTPTTGTRAVTYDANEILLGEDEIGYDPYEGTDKALTPAEKKLLRKMPKYGLNEYTLSTQNMNQLYAIAALMKKKPALKLEIGGFGDNVGDPEQTKKIAYGRAETARRFLLKQGISPDRLGIKVYGEDNPRVPNDSEANRAINRRVEFKLVR
jgi:type IX secretion system PorP/SprF family membrane protein